MGIGLGFRQPFGVAASSASGPADPVAILGAANIIWLKPYDATKYTLAGQGYSEITDAGTLRLVTVQQATDANRPRSSTCRGKPAILLDAGSQLRLRASATFSVLSTTCTVIRVCKAMAFGAGTMIPWSGGSSTFSQQVIDGTDWRMSAGTNQTVADVVPAGHLAAWESSFIPGANSRQYKNCNNTSIHGPVNAGTNTAPTDLFWGSSAAGASYASGQECELIIYNGTLTNQQRTDLLVWFEYMWKISEPQATVTLAGDSNIAGVGSADGDGIRRRLYDSWSVTTCGGVWPQQIGSLGDLDFADDRHNGLTGQTVDGLASQLATVWSGGFYRPDVVFIMIGGNDCANNGATYSAASNGASSTVGRAAALVEDAWDAISAWNPDAVVLWSNLKDSRPSQVTENANKDDFNAAIPGYISTMQGASKNVFLHDLAGSPAGTYHVDYYEVAGDHFNDDGYARWAPYLLADFAVHLATAA